jgi:hypothetical protein
MAIKVPNRQNSRLSGDYPLFSRAAPPAGPPVASGALSDQLLQRNTGVQTFDTSVDFSVLNDPTLSRPDEYHY